MVMMDDYIRDLTHALHLLTSGDRDAGIDLLEGVIEDMERDERERVNEGIR